MAQTSIITGQYVCIRQPAATVMQRAVAWAIDYAIIAFSTFASILFFAALNQSVRNAGEFSLALFMIGQVVIMAYPFLMETFNNGQSVGKMVTGIKVAQLDGSKPTTGAYLLRWLLLIIDMSLGFVGLTFIIFTKNSQRLGDLAAGTTVVKVKRQNPSITHFNLEYVDKNYQPSYPEAVNLSMKQFDVIALTLYHTQNDMRDNDIRILGGKVQQVLGIYARENTPEAFLYTIANDFLYYTRKVV